jgi:aspartyl/asparaginyl-tRNA synthetase
LFACHRCPRSISEFQRCDNIGNADAVVAFQSLTVLTRSSALSKEAAAGKNGRVLHRVFEMKKMFRTKNGSIHLSDGWSGSTLTKDKGGPEV